MRSDRARTALLTLFISALGCDGRSTVDHPRFGEASILDGAESVPATSLPALRGIYRTGGDLADFGAFVSVHANGRTLSLFGDEDARYATLEGGCLEEGTRLVLEGEHRIAVSAATGLIRLEVLPTALARAICAADGSASDPALHSGARLEGLVGDGSDRPDRHVTATFVQPLVAMDDFAVGGHRGGCRTIDECGPSENSIESILFAERFGATTVEIDVRFTRDGIPILYHDEKLSARLATGRFCVGYIDDLTLAHLDANCRLRFGEAIPTLEDALDTALASTSLRAIWLDVKEAEDVPRLLEITDRVHERAAASGRDFSVYIGCPSREVYDAFVAEERADAPCLVELGLDETISAGCEVWAPRYTLGPMPSEVARARDRGIRTFFWTVDGQEFVDLLLTESEPAGILSNRPHLVFHRYQMIRGGLE